MRKSKKLLNQIIEELRKIPNVSSVCNNLGISRQTFYRWKEDDMDFFEEVEEALEMGHESINDLAESVVITKMKEGQLSAAKYWLENNKRKYIKPRRKEDLAGRITGNAIVFVDGTMEESEDIAST